MSSNEYKYRELQKMNEQLRRENHLLRLLDELQREIRDTGTSTSVPVSGSQDTLVGYAGEKNGGGAGSAGTESQGTLFGDVGQTSGENAGPSNEASDKEDREETGQKMDVDTHGDKTEGEHEQHEDKQPEEKEEEEEEENSQDNESNASDVQSESTWVSNATDEDSKDQDEDESEREEQLLRELHRCNPLAHRNAALSSFKRDVLESKTATDDLHIQLHKELQACLDGRVYILGHCKLDASLYMASESTPNKRTDVWVYRTLYGLHPALVSWIDYEPTLRLLDKHAEIKASLQRRDWGSEFVKRFDYFIEILERSGCLSGYLDNMDTPDEREEYKTNVAVAYQRCVYSLAG